MGYKECENAASATPEFAHIQISGAWNDVRAAFYNNSGEYERLWERLQLKLDGIDEFRGMSKNRFDDVSADYDQVTLSIIKTISLCAEPADFFNLGIFIGAIYKIFGAPGDWGYGTSQGDSLRWLYCSTRLLSLVAKNAERLEK